eukprot:jgi/Botrbrau1/21172/Bobra.0061s0064.1
MYKEGSTSLRDSFRAFGFGPLHNALERVRSLDPGEGVLRTRKPSPLAPKREVFNNEPPREQEVVTLGAIQGRLSKWPYREL